uniref:Secreted protein n=1 Tax=Oryza rufipogon TaxID=4529 RepID=A0A0E0Q0W1_ORYRU
MVRSLCFRGKFQNFCIFSLAFLCQYSVVPNCAFISSGPGETSRSILVDHIHKFFASKVSFSFCRFGHFLPCQRSHLLQAPKVHW